jgi:tetratricopeptide (TPR) repeat protein
MKESTMSYRGSIVVGIVAAMGTMLLSASAVNAAVSVLGNGLAADCYQAAEFGANPSEGIAVCSRALEDAALTPTDKAATLINRGILRARADDPQAAMTDYDSGLKIDPGLGEGYVDRGATEIVLKDFDRALADINKGISLKANRLEIAYYDRAIVDEANGDVKAAYEDYKMAVRLAPDFGLASEQLSRFKVVRKGSTGT